jgi:tetratricopeptide (TPR) repeat protein
MTEGKKRALVIGIHQYDDDNFHPLPYAEKDAEEVYRVLHSPDFGVFSDIVLFTPKGEFKVTKSAVEQKLEEIFMEAKKDDTILVYFAGHGKLDRNFNLRLAAQDSKYDRLVSTSINMETIRSIVANSDCRRSVFIIDSCYSGAAGLVPRSPDYVKDSLERSSGEGTILISASQAFQEALESEHIKQGIFTNFFVKGLEEEEIDYDRDGYISVDEIYKYVSNNVKEETRNRQVPAMMGRAEGKIYIAKSRRFIRERNEEIESKLTLVEESLRIGKLEKAFDGLRKVLKLDSKNEEALGNIKNLIERVRNDLENYQVNQEDKIETDIYDKAVDILKKSYPSFTNMEAEYVRCIASLLSGLSLENFERLWRATEKKEQTLNQQERDKLKILDEERKARIIEPSWQPEMDKPPTQLYSATARVEPVPVTDGQPLRVDQQRAKETAQVVISYSHKDQKWVDHLKTMGGPIKSIEVWYDREIEPGEEWRKEIKEKLEAANIAILFVSEYFLDSKFIKENELPPLIKAANERGVIILWIYVSECLYEEIKEIEKRQAAHDISKPLDSLSESELNKVLKQICMKIKEAAEKVLPLRKKADENILAQSAQRKPGG